MEVGIAEIQNSAQELANALESNPDNLTKSVTMPRGKEMSLYRLSLLAANHIVYHNGQLTYVQCLHGDDKFHWMDE